MQNPLIPRDKIAIMWLVPHTSCKSRLYWANKWCCIPAQWHRMKSSVALLWSHNVFFKRFTATSTFLKLYMNTWEALPFTDITESGAGPAVCVSVQHFSLKLMEDEADEVEYSKTTEAQKWWISDGSLLLARFCFALASPLLCHGPDNMSAQCAHYVRRHFPPPSREKPADEQVSIIHVRDEHKCHSFHPCLTQV